MNNEVCYERMRPPQIVVARQNCPVAYLPLGTIEWHGRHNPVGLDGLKAQALAVRCAQAGGGLVFPPLFYGESREEGIMEVGAADCDRIVAEMQLPPETFAPGFMRFSPREQYENYQRLLLHCLFQVRSLGFKVAALVAGHYPLLDHARAACQLFHQSRWNNRRAEMITWAFTGYDLVRERFPDGGDHGGFWETSLALALLPGLADLNELPDDPEAELVGVLSNRPVQDSSADFGERAVAAIVERAMAEVRERLEKPKAYYGHGLRF
jgi:creatinine amidohydrolase